MLESEPVRLECLAPTGRWRASTVASEAIVEVREESEVPWTLVASLLRHCHHSCLQDSRALTDSTDLTCRASVAFAGGGWSLACWEHRVLRKSFICHNCTRRGTIAWYVQLTWSIWSLCGFRLLFVDVRYRWQGWCRRRRRRRVRRWRREIHRLSVLCHLLLGRLRLRVLGVRVQHVNVHLLWLWTHAVSAILFSDRLELVHLAKKMEKSRMKGSTWQKRLESLNYTSLNVSSTPPNIVINLAFSTCFLNNVSSSQTHRRFEAINWIQVLSSQLI